MNQVKDQRGVALVLELVLVAVVLAAAGLGVYAAMHHKATPPVSASPTTAKSNSPKPTPEPTHYFTITQWGIRAPYDGSDMYTYSIVNDTWGSMATVISGNLAAKYAGCKTYGAGQIKRLAPTTIASRALTTDSNLTVEQYAQQNPSLGFKHVGNYYYLFMHDQAACQDNDVADEQNSANDSVRGLVAKFEPVNP